MDLKEYKQLTLPVDSAWGRKSIKKYLPIWLKEIITGISNLLKWAPTIWKNRDWDASYIYDILQKKIEFQRKELVEANRHYGVEDINKYTTICLNLLERVRNDFYNMEYAKYHESKFDFIPVEDNKDVSKLEISVISEKFDEYISKNKLTHRKVVEFLNENKERYTSPPTDKKLQCMIISQFKQEKAKRLLFKILENKIEYWWD